MVKAEIRIPHPGEYEAIYRIYEPYVLHTAVSFETTPPGPASFSERITGSIGQFPWLIASEGGTVAGYAYASGHRQRSAYRWSAETSVYVDTSCHRRGIARGLYTSLLEILRLLGYRTALAGITLPNEASVGFHESMGFSPIGRYRNIGFKSGRWHDTGWWQKPLSDYEGIPADPVPFTSLAGTDMLADALGAGSALIRPRS